MTPENTMPFGKYRGKKMKYVPVSYLLYLYNERIVSIKNWNRVYWYIREYILKDKDNEEKLL